MQRYKSDSGRCLSSRSVRIIRRVRPLLLPAATGSARSLKNASAMSDVSMSEKEADAVSATFSVAPEQRFEDGGTLDVGEEEEETTPKPEDGDTANFARSIARDDKAAATPAVDGSNQAGQTAEVDRRIILEHFELYKTESVRVVQQQMMQPMLKPTSSASTSLAPTKQKIATAYSR